MGELIFCILWVFSGIMALRYGAYLDRRDGDVEKTLDEFSRGMVVFTWVLIFCGPCTLLMIIMISNQGKERKSRRYFARFTRWVIGEGNPDANEG